MSIYGDTYDGLVEDSAELLERYNPELAKLWRLESWRRVDLARGFACGFVSDPSDDVEPVASLVLDTAYKLQRYEKAVRQAESL